MTGKGVLLTQKCNHVTSHLLFSPHSQFKLLIHLIDFIATSTLLLPSNLITWWFAINSENIVSYSLLSLVKEYSTNLKWAAILSTVTVLLVLWPNVCGTELEVVIKSLQWWHHFFYFRLRNPRAWFVLFWSTKRAVYLLTSVLNNLLEMRQWSFF